MPYYMPGSFEEYTKAIRSAARKAKVGHRIPNNDMLFRLWENQCPVDYVIKTHCMREQETPKPSETPIKEPSPLLGFQIVHTETDDPPDGMTTYEIYPLHFVVQWFRELSPQDKPNWRMLPVFEGDIDEPARFPKGPQRW